MSSGQKNSSLYERASERRGAKVARESERSMFRPLTFDHCALTLQPFRDPVLSNVSHYVFDITAIVPFIQKYKVDPIVGTPMTLKDLTKLTYHKLESGKYGCPVTFKEFTDFSHIVCIKTSGHVYSYEAIQELNIKAGNWTCLMTGVPFTKSDIIVLQDPHDPDRRNVQQFHHIRMGQKSDPNNEDGEEGKVRADSSVKAIMAEAEKLKERREQSEELKKKRERDAALEAGFQEVGAADNEEGSGDAKKSASFTMAGFTGKTEAHFEVPAKKTQRKGKVNLQTSLGALEIILHCDKAPVACENFLRLCASGYYVGSKLHRLVKGFMVQGGDAEDGGRGGKSCWGGRPFQDELNNGLSHSRRGMMAMANSGPNTNQSQFYILMQARPHLDKKHTVFGELSSGWETLDAIEEVPVDTDKVPLTDIIIQETQVVYDPFQHLQEEREEEEKKRQQQLEGAVKGNWFSDISAAYPKPPVVRQGVGKYLQTGPQVPVQQQNALGSVANKAKTKKPKTDFGSIF